MYRFHRYNLIRWDISSPPVAYKLFVRGLYDYVIVKEETSSSVTTRGYFVASKGIETSWSNRASLTYSNDIQGRKLVNEGQNWLLANTGGEVFSGLLDEYGGAAAAYSLRKLSSTYSGDAIVVRRSSDNATQSIGFVNNELDTSSLNSFCSGANGFVTTWYDQSGNSSNAIQTAASTQPKIFDSISGVILNNGKPSLYFDGNENRIIANSLARKARLDTYFVVNQSDTSYLYPTVISSSIFGFFATSGSSNTAIYQDYGTPSLYANTSIFTGSTRNDVYNFLNGSKIVVHQNASTAAFGSYNFGIYAAGTDINFNGYLSELIAYDNDQSGNRTGIETNINDFYSIY